MSTKLILQGPGADEASLRAIAALASPAAMRMLSSQALRCDDVDASATVRSQVAQAALAARVDANFIARDAHLADYSLLAMDMDSTLITIECIEEIADMQGLKPQVAAITESAMRGEMTCTSSVRRGGACLAGRHEALVSGAYEERLHLPPGAEALLAAVKAA